MASLTSLSNYANMLADNEMFQARDRYKDKALALLVANGMALEEAARELGIDSKMALLIARSPLFNQLVEKLRKEREISVYADDPDEAVEAEARNNYWTLRQIRDNNSAKDSDRLKAVSLLHEARPSVRKQKVEDNVVKVVLDVEVINRIKEGMKKVSGQSLELEEPAIEGEFKEIKEES